MAKYVLSNEVSMSQGGQMVRLPAGKVVDDLNQNIARILAAGGVLVPYAGAAVAQAAAATKQRLRGQGLPLDQARAIVQIPVPVVPGPAVAVVVRVNADGTGGAHASPYNANAGETVVCDTGPGNVVVNLPVLASGQACTVQHDASTSLASHTITTNGPAGVQLEQPAPNNAAFAANYVIAGAQSAGVSLTWINGGSAGGYLLE